MKGKALMKHSLHEKTAEIKQSQIKQKSVWKYLNMPLSVHKIIIETNTRACWLVCWIRPAWKITKQSACLSRDIIRDMIGCFIRRVRRQCKMLLKICTFAPADKNDTLKCSHTYVSHRIYHWQLNQG